MREIVYRHIFFDIDDTITYYRRDYTPDDFVRDVFGVFAGELSLVSGMEVPQAEVAVRRYADEVIWYDYGDFIREFGLDGNRVWEGLRRIHREHLGFHEDAVNLIRFLVGDPSCRLYVISNNPLSGCLLKLAVAGLAVGDAAPVFTRIFGTNVTHGMKSQVHTWRRALELIGSDGGNVTTIGDNLKEDGLIPRSCGVASSVIICRHGALQEELPSGMTVSHDLNEFVEESMSEELDKLTFVEGAVEAAGFVKAEGDYVILFKGNSITRHAFTPKTVANLGWDHESGMAASSSDKDYVHLFARGVQRQLLGRRVRVVFGRGGRPELARLGLEEERVFAPDLVVIQNGEHSAFAPEVDSFEEQHRRLIQETKACFPGARVISVGIWNPRCREEFAACTAPDYDVCAKRVEGIQRRIAEECGIVFIPVSPYENDPANTGNGKVAGVRWHPSDSGMACYAEALLQAFMSMN